MDLYMSALALILFLTILSVVGRRIKYERSNYKKECGAGFGAVFGDKGRYGEYLTYRELEHIKGEHKILTNVYLPTANGGTTEIDLIYIHESGIYVIESKNYSGWIFGNESDRKWTQVFKNQRKEKFYNPIMQNKGHIKNLSRFLRLNINADEIKSIIVFSERCTLKKITLQSENVKVIKRNDLRRTMKSLIRKSDVKITEAEINDIYSRLKTFCNVDNSVKQDHIDNINKKYK